jgi:hypothetical protein
MSSQFNGLLIKNMQLMGRQKGSLICQVGNINIDNNPTSMSWFHFTYQNDCRVSDI